MASVPKQSAAKINTSSLPSIEGATMSKDSVPVQKVLPSPNNYVVPPAQQENNPDSSPNLMFWSDSINISLHSYSSGHIDCVINLEESFFKFTGFYGNPNTPARRFSWDLLRRLGSDPIPQVGAWLVGGDFNEIFYEVEKKGGNPRSFSQMKDLKASGPMFTWSNKRRGRATIREKLDRFCGSLDFLSLFKDHEVSNLDFYGSDHRPVKITFCPKMLVHST